MQPVEIPEDGEVPALGDALGIGYIEQGGGRVLTVDGKPVEATSVHEETMQASSFLAAQSPWAAPLVEAALLAAANGEFRQAKYFTSYGNDVAGVHEDAAKHAALIEHVKANCPLPWFWNLLDSAGATVALIHGEDPRFTFYVSTRPSVQFDIPGIACASLRLVPFVEDGETAQ